MTFQSLPPAGRQLDIASAIIITFLFYFVFLVLISSVPSQCPATMLTLWSRLTVPCY
jgi:hypothetical protein